MIYFVAALIYDTDVKTSSLQYCAFKVAPTLEGLRLFLLCANAMLLPSFLYLTVTCEKVQNAIFITYM